MPLLNLSTHVSLTEVCVSDFCTSIPGLSDYNLVSSYSEKWCRERLSTVEEITRKFTDPHTEAAGKVKEDETVRRGV